MERATRPGAGLPTRDLLGRVGDLLGSADLRQEAAGAVELFLLNVCVSFHFI